MQTILRYYGSMQRLRSLALLTASLLITTVVEAQGGQVVGSPALGSGSPPACCRNHPFPGPFGPQGHNSVLIPLFPFAFDQPSRETVVTVTQPVVAPRPAQPVAPISTPAKIIEVPEPKGNNRPNSTPIPAVFVFSDGRQMVAQRYILTSDTLYVSVDRQQLRFPLSTLDLKATFEANRHRGLDLRVPADGNEVILGF